MSFLGPQFNIARSVCENDTSNVDLGVTNFGIELLKIKTNLICAFINMLSDQAQ